MTLTIKKVNRISAGDNIIYLVNSLKDLNKSKLSLAEQEYIRKKFSKGKKDLISINRLNQWIFVHIVNKKRPEEKRLEELRRSGSKLHGWLNNHKAESATLIDFTGKNKQILAFVEGMGLSSYQFLKYKKDKKEETYSFKSLKISAHAIKKQEVEELKVVLDAVFRCRDMVNEPVSELNAPKLGSIVKEMGSESGARVEVMGKKKIESLKMGGLLAVNKGSYDPPTFSIMEWKPIEPVNSKPYVLVGKGVVYDTGGLNIKTGNYMENMKSDMAGAATMAATIYAIARLRLNVHVIAL
jgi:leucyl aminopeptidase